MNILAEDGSAWRSEFVVRARPFSRRWRRARLIGRARASLPLPILGVGILIALFRFTLVDLPGDVLALALPVPLWLLGLALSYGLDRPPLARLAQAIDAQLGLDERLGSAVAFAAAPAAGPNARLVRRLRVDALDILALQGGDAARSFRPHIPAARAALLIAALLGVALIPLVLVPSPVAEARTERAALRIAAAAQADRLAQVRRQAVARPELPAPTRDAIAAQLSAAEAALRAHPADRPANVAALSQAADTLHTLLPANYTQQTAARNAAARDLESALSAVQDVPPEGNTELERAASAAGAALNSLAQPNLNHTSQLAVAGAMDRIAQQLGTSDPQLTAALQAAAHGVRQGPASASPALKQLATALQQIAQEQAAADLLAGTLSQVDDSKQQIAEAGLPAVAQGDGTGAPRPLGRLNRAPAGVPAPAGANAAGAAPGQSNAGGAQPSGGGTDPGSGSSSTGGAGAGSNGAPQAGSAGANAPPGNARLPGNVQGGGGTQNGGAGQAGTGSGRAAGGQVGTLPAGSGPVESVYVPGQATPAALPGGPQVQVPGVESPGGTGQDVTTVVHTPQGATTGVKTPYTRVIGQYRAAAAQALDHSAIPVDAKQYVRDYFNSIAPTQ
ncbi:MAG TPA: hypothetical protein VKY74_13225 [Chloroflexia bacterium]|nr:hypothetical protein [Chloroflexia bacterium]